jgi:ADP-ribose pyrophosphatase YjhB (NUDIX family)
VRRIKRSVAIAVRDADHGERVLMVQRPPDDEDLPDAWGLPAASLRADESWPEAALRAGREKLGVELTGLRELNRGHAQRAGYQLEMRVYEARIVAGEPNVMQETPGVTHYRQLRWDTAELLAPAAARGSLCCRLFLETAADR